jgi:hypothetical protein
MEVRGHFESISNEKRTLYLSSNGNAESVFQSGALTEKPASGAADGKWV